MSVDIVRVHIKITTKQVFMKLVSIRPFYAKVKQACERRNSDRLC